MENEILNAENEEAVHPQENNAESAEVVTLQGEDIEAMSDTEFEEYIANAEAGYYTQPNVRNEKDNDGESVQTDEADEPSEDKKNASEVTQQSGAEAYRTYQTKEEFQNDIDKLIGSRLKRARESDEKYENVMDVVREFYGQGDDKDVLSRLSNDLKEAAIAKRGITSEEYEKEREIAKKAYEYDKLTRKNAQENADKEKQAQTLSRWQAESEELKKSVPDFDFEKALASDKFYKRIVQGYSVEDAWRLENPTVKTQVQKRKPIVQGGAKAKSQAGGVEADVSKMSDKEFEKYINKCISEE